MRQGTIVGLVWRQVAWRADGGCGGTQDNFSSADVADVTSGAHQLHTAASADLPISGTFKDYQSSSDTAIVFIFAGPEPRFQEANRSNETCRTAGFMNQDRRPYSAGWTCTATRGRLIRLPSLLRAIIQRTKASVLKIRCGDPELMRLIRVFSRIINFGTMR